MDGHEFFNEVDELGDMNVDVLVEIEPESLGYLFSLIKAEDGRYGVSCNAYIGYKLFNSKENAYEAAIKYYLKRIGDYTKAYEKIEQVITNL